MEKKPVRKPVHAAGTVNNTAARIARRRALQRKKQKQQQMIRYGIIAAAAVAVIVLLVVLLAGGHGDTTAQITPEPTVTAEPTPEPTAAPTAQPIEYLPVYKQGTTSEKKICITVDDCFQVDNLEALMDLCVQYGAKITIFPIGEQVYKKSTLQSALRRAYELGFEIENHTYSHSKLYAMTDEEMAADIYKQNMAVNYALGMEYEMHFLRMMGGNGEKDLRSHQYLIQLGTYKAVMHWGFSGSDDELPKIKKALEPGQIYLFHTTNRDWKILQEFIPWVISQGYELITLNEMFGYEANETHALTGNALEYEIPEPYPFVYTEYVEMTKKPRTQMYVVQLLQKRLQELGFLSYNAVVDGDYGSTTEAAVIAFQNAAGLSADGIAGASTQSILFSDEAPINTGLPVEPEATATAEADASTEE